MNLYEKLSAITAELQTVAKNLEVKTGKSAYKAVSERDILDAVKPLENKSRIYSYPCDREIIETQTLETQSDYGTKTTFFSRIKTTYRFVDLDEPNTFIETITFSEGIDPQDKGSGKAMTYGDKYALMKAYKISTGEDPDQTASEETKYTRVSSTPRLICQSCGREIKGYRLSDGSVVTTDQLVTDSVNRFGKKLCARCYRTEAISQELKGGECDVK